MRIEIYENRVEGKMFTEEVEVQRTFIFDYETTAASDLEAADEAFHMFNAPEEFLNEWQLKQAKAWRAKRLSCLSVGDVVVCDGRQYLCCGCGWKHIARPITDPFGPLRIVEE